MTLHLAGALLAGSIWLLAVVLAWPAGSPIAAVVLLAAQAVLYAAVAIGDAASDAPSTRPASLTGRARRSKDRAAQQPLA